MDEDQGLIGNAQELITGAVVLLIGYVIYSAANSEWGKFFSTAARTADSALGLVNQLLSSPVLGAVVLAVLVALYKSFGSAGGLFRKLFVDPKLADMFLEEATRQEIKRKQAEEKIRDASLSPEERLVQEARVEEAKRALEELTNARYRNPDAPEAGRKWDAARIKLSENFGVVDIIGFYEKVTADTRFRDTPPHQIDVRSITSDDAAHNEILKQLKEASEKQLDALREGIRVHMDEVAVDASYQHGVAKVQDKQDDFIRSEPARAGMLQHISKAKGSEGDRARDLLNKFDPQGAVSFQNAVPKVFDKHGINPGDPSTFKDISKAERNAKPGDKRPSEEGGEPGEHAHAEVKG
jgi:hypothetical protein